MTETRVRIPSQRFLDFCPAWGLRAFEAFDRTVNPCRRFSCEVHRKGRKDVTALNLMVREACANPGRQFLYVGETRVEVKQTVWTNPQMLFSYLPPQDVFPWKSNEQDLTVALPNGSVIYFRGGDDADKLRGPDWYAVVFSEWSKTNPDAWDVIRPIFTQGGDRWAWFSYTPMGDNHATQQHDAHVSDPEWFCVRLNCLQTGIMPAEEVERARREMPRAMFEQELMVSRITDEDRVLITSAMLERLRDVRQVPTIIRRVVSVDPSSGGDECPILGMENGVVMAGEYVHIRDTMQIVLKTQIMCRRLQTQNVVIDEIGEGKGCADRLAELGFNVIRFNSSESSADARCVNRRAEAWWYVMEQVRDGLVPYPEDDECRRQLSSVRYELRGQGKVIMELKDHVRSRLGCSPDRADAWVMGQWATQHVRPGGGVARQRHDYEDRPSYSAMTA